MKRGNLNLERGLWKLEERIKKAELNSLSKKFEIDKCTNGKIEFIKKEGYLKESI